MRRYDEQYDYDGVGNFMRMIHQAANGGSWTRDYAYDEASLIEPQKQSNRLSRTIVSPDVAKPLDESYTHDIHGNMTSMPHLPLMQWDFKDRMQASARQVFNDGTPETTWYVYNASGQRVRKVTERQAATGQEPTRMNERIYLGGFEVYREYENDVVTVRLERQTLHVTDDKQRVALVESRTQGDDGSPAQLTRYQFGNHLGSACLELDEEAVIICYEEYFPYGSTAFQAGRNVIGVSSKRYRYTGKERDEETGLGYHGARYYAPWLGSWTSADPTGLADGPNLFRYARSNPVNLVDTNGAFPTVAIQQATQVAAQKAEIDAKREPATARSGQKQALDQRVATPEQISEYSQPPPIQELYPEIRGSVSLAYDESAATAFSPSASFWDREVAQLKMTFLAPFALFDKGGEAILNVPRNADLAGQYIGRGMTRQNETAALDDYARAIGLLSEAILALAEPASMRPAPGPRGTAAGAMPTDTRPQFAARGAAHQDDTRAFVESLADPGSAVLSQVKIQTGKWRAIHFVADFVVQIEGVWRVFDAKGATKRWTKAQERQVPVFQDKGGIAHKPGVLPKGGMQLDASQVLVVTPEMLQLGNPKAIWDLLTR